MRLRLALAVCLMASGCSQKPVNCGIVKEQLSRCMDKNHNSNRETTLNCFPYSASERISGTWAHSFEFNQFYEDQMPMNVTRAFTIQDNPVTLEVVSDELYDTLHPTNGGVPLSQISQIVFEGRRPLCDFGWARWIVVDRLVSQKIVFSKPYGER